jgi:hypothetical protein
MSNELDKLMRNPHFISVTTSKDGLAWVATMNSIRAGNNWVNADGEYVPDDIYEIYIHKGTHRTPVIKDPRLDYLKPEEFKTGRPSCYIVDIDGTVSLINGRNPYDGTKVHTDIVNLPIARLLDNFISANSDAVIIYSTGRNEKYRDVTTKWLEENDLWDDFGEPLLLMRPPGEKKPDAEVKKDNYYKHIHGKYNVELVIEDRSRVVTMYRDDLKLPTIVPWYDNF